MSQNQPLENFKNIQLLQKDAIDLLKILISIPSFSKEEDKTAAQIINFLTGGLNHQIEHHLFPQINHIYYPQIQKHVKKFCKKNKLPYNNYKNIFHAYYDHLKHLYNVGGNV